MEQLDYQGTIIEPPRPTGLVWTAAGIVIAVALGVLIWQITAIMRLFRSTAMPDALGAPFWIALAIVLAAVGILVLELYSIWFQSRRASEALGTIFAAPPFIVLPPILEALAKLVHIPGISDSAADWKTAGILLAVGAICGFIGYSHFAWYVHLGRAPAVVKVESVEEPVNSPADIEPPTSTPIAS